MCQNTAPTIKQQPTFKADPPAPKFNVIHEMSVEVQEKKLSTSV